MELNRQPRARHLPDSQDSRSLLRGRVLSVQDEQRPIPGAILRAGSEVYRTDRDGIYDIPLDGHELPVRLTISAPGYVDRVESVDWTPILPGGLLMRDFLLLDASLIAGHAPSRSLDDDVDALFDPDEPTVETEVPELPRLNLQLDPDALLEMVKPARAPRPVRPPPVPEPEGRRKSRGSADESPIVHDPTTIGGLSADIPYLPPEDLGIPRLEIALAQPGVLDSLLDRLSEQEEHILVSGSPWSSPLSGMTVPQSSLGEFSEESFEVPEPSRPAIDVDEAFHETASSDPDSPWDDDAADDSMRSQITAAPPTIAARSPQDYEAGFDDDEFDAGWAQGSDDPDDGFGEDGFGDEGFSEDGFGDEGFSEDGFEDDAHDEEPLRAEGYGEDDFGEDAFHDDAFHDDAFHDEDFGDDELAADGLQEDTDDDGEPPRDSLKRDKAESVSARPSDPVVPGEDPASGVVGAPVAAAALDDSSAGDALVGEDALEAGYAIEEFGDAEPVVDSFTRTELRAVLPAYVPVARDLVSTAPFPGPENGPQGLRASGPTTVSPSKPIAGAASAPQAGINAATPGPAAGVDTRSAPRREVLLRTSDKDAWEFFPTDPNAGRKARELRPGAGPSPRVAPSNGALPGTATPAAAALSATAPPSGASSAKPSPVPDDEDDFSWAQSEDWEEGDNWDGDGGDDDFGDDDDAW